MNITQRLNRTIEPSGDAMMDRLYADMMKRVEADALEQARKEVKLDVAKHLADVVRMQGEVSGMKSERDAAILRNSSFETLAGDSKAEADRMRTERDGFERGLMTVKSSWSATKEKLKTNSSDMNGELLNEQLKSEQLRLKVASLEGRISELKKVKPVMKTATRIPSFDFTPTKNADGRIISLRADPIGMN